MTYSSGGTPTVPEVCPVTGLTSIVVPAMPESAVVARNFLRENTSLDSMRHTEADLLVTELICNAIRHTTNVTELKVEIQDEHLQGVKTAVVHESASPLKYDRPGLGFQLLERLSRRWGHDFRDGRLSVWFVVRKPGLSALNDGESDRDLARLLDVDDVTRSEVFVRRHRDLATAIAWRYRGKGIPIEDLNQVALMALHKAIQRYDPDMGDLRPYAAATISGELKHLLRDSGWSVRVPRPIQDRALQASKAFEALTQELGREPSAAELAEHLEMTEEETMEAVWARLLYASRSVDRESARTGSTILEYLECEEPDIDPEDRLLLEEAIGHLGDREARIVELRFMEDKTQQEIAEIVGVSQMHVSRLLTGALRDMKNFLDSNFATA